MKKKIITYILLALALFLILAQFKRIDKSLPSSVDGEDFVQLEQPDAHITSLIKEACYDCHSNETRYPWYADLAPVSWWLQGHVTHGREHLNFSTWAQYSEKKKAHKLEECVEVIEGKEMPMFSYLITHRKARISKEERKELAAYFGGL